MRAAAKRRGIHSGDMAIVFVLVCFRLCGDARGDFRPREGNLANKFLSQFVNYRDATAYALLNHAPRFSNSAIFVV
jgi:hypothetical protein